LSPCWLCELFVPVGDGLGFVGGGLTLLKTGDPYFPWGHFSKLGKHVWTRSEDGDSDAGAVLGAVLCSVRTGGEEVVEIVDSTGFEQAASQSAPATKAMRTALRTPNSPHLVDRPRHRMRGDDGHANQQERAPVLGENGGSGGL
jgi:hypothetical protein